MPAEFAPHQATWMSWPTRESLWSGRLDDARDAWAATARAVAAFEPVTMVCDTGEADDVGRRCGTGVDALGCPIDDSWLRDNGPIFVRNDRGEVALVHFGFNSWGGKYHRLGSRRTGRSWRGPGTRVAGGSSSWTVP
jgi:agmatine deiminase